MIHDKYWLALQSALGQGAMLRPFIKAFGGAKEILALTEAQRMASGLFTPKQSQRLDDADLNSAERTLRLCKENGWLVYTYEDELYPECLRQIPNPPAALFCQGSMPDFERRLSVGIVGAREASRYALKATDYLSYVIARCGGIIVSGGAMGVDSASHRAALRAGGTTVAVLGCGFGTKYLMQYEAMRDEISKTGALLTEYPPYTAVYNHNFPLRNRLISALSDGVVVVEAAVKSGSLITAKRASEQGRDVFAVPGSIVSHAYMGTNRLLADGAIPALSPEIILGYYRNKYSSLAFDELLTLGQWQETNAQQTANIPEESSVNQQVKPGLDEVDAEKEAARQRQINSENLPEPLCTIYNSLTEEYRHIDIIIKETELGGPAVISALTQLELMGLASSASGKRYRKD